jgi:transposase
MIDSTHLKVHRTAASLLKGGDSPRCIGRTKGDLNFKLHAVCNGTGRPISLLLAEGQMSDHKGASLISHALPDAEASIADKGYDSDAFRRALADRGIYPCIPPREKRRSPAPHCKTLYKQRHKVENMFVKLKDWRRLALCYGRCAHAFSAICIVSTVIFWLGK